MVAAAVEIVKALGGQAQVAPGFEQAESDFFVGAEAVGEGLAQEAALFHQLEEEMGDLE